MSETTTLVKKKVRGGKEVLVEPKKGSGQYYILDDKVIREKFLTAKKFGANDDKACDYAGISLTALRNYKKKYTTFSNECREVAAHVDMHARKRLVDLMYSEDEKVVADAVKFYLKHKLGDEYHELSRKEVKTTRLSAIISMGKEDFFKMASQDLQNLMKGQEQNAIT